jgi:hypothetical protein
MNPQGTKYESIPSLLMPYRQTVQHLPAMPPVGHVAVHEGDETGVVGWLQQLSREYISIYRENLVALSFKYLLV